MLFPVLDFGLDHSGSWPYLYSYILFIKNAAITCQAISFGRPLLTYLRYEPAGLHYSRPLLDVGGRRVRRGEGDGPPTAAQDGLPEPRVGHVEDESSRPQGV